ncbi:hypothetical protein MTR_0027s0040 [Medicago truncatula]|uniref:Uncharacterized protein n=1 Tax=Medicago truncatula TaxID=3880 RepID=A0A072TIN7_MEDTR|nr:hypothetical protein MTR_0027s0040 [Medicago truncatula]
MATYDEWVSAGGDQWMQMEADHNARWNMHSLTGILAVDRRIPTENEEDRQILSREKTIFDYLSYSCLHLWTSY